MDNVPFLICVSIIVVFWRLSRIGRRPKDCPLGPPTIPLLGNIHLIPKHDVHLQFQKWAQEYGPVCSVMLGSKVLILLSSDNAIKEILDKRSSVSSDRMDLYMGQTLASGGLRVLMMRYGPTWRMIRRTLHRLLNIHAACSFEPYQVLEAQQMMYDILTEPARFTEHIRRYANSITTATTFGYRVITCEDPYFQEFFKVFGEFVLIAQTGVALILDYLPALRLLPSWVLPLKRRAKTHHKREKALYRYHWDKAKESILSSKSNPSFSVGLVDEQRKYGFGDDFASYITGTLLEAGSDTTSNTLNGFICAMLLFPDVQRRAQDELDQVVGSSRSPSPEDEGQLQYVRGCVKESLRWMPTTILGAIPHALTQDEYYMGFRLPKGAGLLNNVYTIHGDAARYPDPRRFDPQRYKDDNQSFFDAATNPDVSKRDHFSFGAGRRICPGIHVAERSLFLAIAKLLWAFEFRCPVDDEGNKLAPDPTKVTQGFVCGPVPFEAVITPRDAHRAAIIHREWNMAKERNLDSRTMQWKTFPGGSVPRRR
ncbi:putative cytochrome P450 [Xylaria cubensis]|nr:putative cytochrome P450 [Xylaria cubensis]